jgi:penicillin-binding protein 1C
MPQPLRRTKYPRALRRFAVRALGLCLLATLLAAVWLWATTTLPAPEKLRARAALGSTRVLDRNGRLLVELADPLGARRSPVPPAEIPLALRQATVAIEDETFYTNPGIEPRGIGRAAWSNLRAGQVVAGGSTITQQLARGFLMEPGAARQQTLERKLREATLALKLTIAYPKDEILALYLNQTYYGGMSYGVEAAARHYFGKPAAALGLAECALLAGLPQAPSRYDPRVSPKAALARRTQVLQAMVRTGAITAAQAETAAAEPLQLAGSAELRAPHFVLYVLDQLAAELGAETVARGGLTITTTLDLGLQQLAETALRRQLAALNRPRAGQPDHRARNGAVVVLGPADGAILAMVGSPDFADAASQGQVNAALALRQPGSAIKPLTYAAALEQGWTPATILLDVPTSFPTREGRPYTPQNYDRTFHGPLSLREALATSSNVAAVRTLDAIGLPALLDIAARLGITTLGQNTSRFGPALTLGGGEVTLLELTGAYAAFANGGQRVTPFAILGVSAEEERRRSGEEEHDALSSSPLLPFSSSPVPVLDPRVAYLIADILSDPYARMRAFPQGTLDIGRPAAAKTGTTTDWRDNWTLGFTPDRVVGVWVGNADGRSMEQVSGLAGAGPVWRQVMIAAHRNLPPRAFQRPPGIVELPVCAEGGLLPSPSCPATRLERFVAGTAPSRPDDTHLVLRVDPLLDCRAPDGYPPERTVSRVFRLLPPEAELWALDARVPRPPRAVCRPVVAAATREDESNAVSSSLRLSFSSSGLPALLAPAPGAVFALSPGVAAERQQIELRAVAPAGIAEVTIVVDGVPFARLSAPPYRVLWPLRAGRHRILLEARDVHGIVTRSDETMFEVR